MKFDEKNSTPVPLILLAFWLSFLVLLVPWSPFAASLEPAIEQCRADAAKRSKDFGVAVSEAKRNVSAVEIVSATRVCELAFKGDGAAQYLLSVYYDKIQDRVWDIYWLRRSAESGVAYAQYSWALLGHDQGKLTDQEFVQWMLKAASNGNPQAQLRVGAWSLGKTSSERVKAAISAEVPLDPLRAYQWFLRAAEGGLPYAQALVAEEQERGVIVHQDQVSARKWYGLAFSNGIDSAGIRLAEMYEKGIGGPIDLAQAAAIKKQNEERLNRILMQQKNSK